MGRLTRIAVTMLEKEQDIGAPPEPPEEDDDGGDDEEEWGFGALQRRFAIKAQTWAETSPNARKVCILIRDQLLSTKPTVKVTRVNFPHAPWAEVGRSFGWAQVEWEWLWDDAEWTEVDDQIEAILKRSSDLAKVFGVDQNQVWNIVDKGSVYEFLSWVITIVYTAKDKKHSLESDVGFGWYELMEANRAKYEKNLTAAILRRMPKKYAQWFQSKGIYPPEIEFPKSTRQRPSLFGQKYGAQWWGKVIMMWYFSFPQVSGQENRWSSYRISR